MNIKRKIGDIAIHVEDLGLHLEIGGFELEMTDLSVAEYIDILKHQKEIAQMQAASIQPLLDILKGGFTPASTKKNPSFEDFLKAKYSPKSSSNEKSENLGEIFKSKVEKASSIQDLIRDLSEMPGIKIEKMDNVPPFYGYGKNE